MLAQFSLVFYQLEKKVLKSFIKIILYPIIAVTFTYKILKLNVTTIMGQVVNSKNDIVPE